VEPRGHLKYYFEGEPPALPAIASFPVASLTGTRSAELKASLGLDLSANFLTALGLPVPGARLAATLWDGAAKFSFVVRDVTENLVDLAELGKAIDGLPVGDNATTSIFLTDASQELLLISRTLTAPSFAVRATHTGGQAFEAAVDGLADVLGEARAGVSWRAESDKWVSFRGPDPVTFAFAVVPCLIDPARRLRFGVSRRDLHYGGTGSPEASVQPAIGDRAGLLSFD
jgi:hypothetical protein